MDAITFLSAGVMLSTAHFGGDTPSDHTPGAYARAEVGGVKIVGAVFRNSYGRGSVLAAGEFPAFGPVSGFVGAVTGYPLHPVLPVVGLTTAVGPLRVSATGYKSVALTVSFEVSLTGGARRANRLASTWGNAGQQEHQID